MGEVLRGAWRAKTFILSLVIDMIDGVPITFEDAVEYGMRLFSKRDLIELARIKYVNPHIRYDADYIEVLNRGLGLWGDRNSELLKNIALVQADDLHFFEVEDGLATQEGAARIILWEMARRASTLKKYWITS